MNAYRWHRVFPSVHGGCNQILASAISRFQQNYLDASFVVLVCSADFSHDDFSDLNDKCHDLRGNSDVGAKEVGAMKIKNCGDKVKGNFGGK